MKSIYVENDAKRRQMTHELSLIHAFNASPLLQQTTDNQDGYDQDDSEKSFVVQLHDAYTDKEERTVCLVLEYMSGGSLEDYVNEVRSFEDHISVC